ncbi:oxygen-dependent tRNA uridine(34) hydroxylase TrhO [Caulobacter sp. LARHSG274]
MSFRVAALYRFTTFEDPAALRGPLAALCCGLGVKGTLLLAREGINGTIAGTPEAVDRVLDHIRALPGCRTLELKFAQAPTPPFHRMKVRIKREIVTLGAGDLDPAANAGTYVEPDDWNALIARDDVVVIDTRNAYEAAIGSFAGAIDPKTASFSDFPAWFRAFRQTWDPAAPPPKVAMFCTGGIRCEKSTAFLKSEGIKQVFHLKGGILNYLETTPAQDSLWRGECFVFDERVAVGHGLAPGTHDLCRGCRMPVGPEDRASEHFIEGVACPACFEARDDEAKARYAERHRQAARARELGIAHVGAVMGRETPD